MSYLNRCIWVPVSGGTGSFVVSAAWPSAYVPSACADPAVIDGTTYHYFAIDLVSGAHEEGDGIYTVSTSTLTRATIRNSSNAGSIVNFVNTPIVYLGGPVANDLLTLATANQTWFVAKTGSDSNSGTSGSPFLTIQHAANVANTYNWANQFFPTVNVGNGTYSQQLLLPNLFNCPNGGVITGNTGSPSSVVVSDTGTNYAVTLDNYACWTISGVKTSGSFGGYDCGHFCILTLQSFDIGGALANFGINMSGVGSALFAATTTLNVSLSTAAYLIFSRCIPVLDGTTVTFANAVTFTSSVIALDDSLSSFEADGLHFVNAANVTSIGNCLQMNNGAFFEADATTLVDGVALTRYNFPGVINGSSVFVDGWSTFQPDGPHRVPVAQNVTYYVDNVHGNDNNPGTVSAPFLTLNFAWFHLSTTLDLKDNALTISLAASASAYTLTVATAFLGGSSVIILGAGSGSTTIDSLGFNNGYSLNTQIWVNKVTLTGSGTGWCVKHGAQGNLNLGVDPSFSSFDLIIGAAATGGLQASVGGAYIFVFSATITNASCTSLFEATTGGFIDLIPVGSFTFSGGSFAYTQTAHVADCGIIVSNATFGGSFASVTGLRFLVTGNGVIDTGGGATAFPGNAAGQWYSGGQYLGVHSTTVAALPAAATVGAGERNFATDSTVTAVSSNFGLVVAGSGANKVPLYCDGTNWRIG